jgi:hypothetical protein
MSDDYYNTNNEAGDTLTDSREQARRQEHAVLAWFQNHPGQHFAPHQIPMATTAPLTSVRRAITNLTDAGLLEKTDVMTMGTFGKQVHTWRLRDEQELSLW